MIVEGDQRKYSGVSLEIRAILLEYDPHMTPMSLDEAYLDFTDHLTQRADLTDEARRFPEYSVNMCRCELAKSDKRVKDAPGGSAFNFYKVLNIKINLLLFNRDDK